MLETAMYDGDACISVAYACTYSHINAAAALTTATAAAAAAVSCLWLDEGPVLIASSQSHTAVLCH
jgi:hypothetical protein